MEKNGSREGNIELLCDLVSTKWDESASSDRKTQHLGGWHGPHELDSNHLGRSTANGR